MDERQAQELIEQLSRLSGKLDEVGSWLPQMIDTLNELMSKIDEDIRSRH